MAGAGAGMRACVSESQSMFETGKGFRQKFTSASVIPLRNAYILRQELFEISMRGLWRGRMPY